MTAEDLQTIDRKLTIIARLLVRSLMPDAPQKDLIAFLQSLDLTSAEIAEVAGTTPGTVRKTLSRLRKQVG